MSVYSEDRPKRDGGSTTYWWAAVMRDGQRLRKRFKTEPEAKACEARWLTGDFSEQAAKPDTLLKALATSKELLWPENEAWRETAANGVVKYAKAMGGDPALASINEGMLEAASFKLIKVQGLSPNSARKYLSSVSKVLKWAKRNKYLDALPLIPWPKEVKAPARWLEADEEKAIFAFLDSHGDTAREVGDFIKVSGLTGVRSGELLRAKPEDVTDDNWFMVWESKNDLPRSVPLLPEARDILKARLPWAINKNTLRYWWNKVREHLGKPKNRTFTPHITRHTLATNLITARVDPVRIQKILGHKKLTTTVGTYAHVKPPELMDAMNTLVDKT